MHAISWLTGLVFDKNGPGGRGGRGCKFVFCISHLLHHKAGSSLLYSFADANSMMIVRSDLFLLPFLFKVFSHMWVREKTLNKKEEGRRRLVWLHVCSECLRTKTDTETKTQTGREIIKRWTQRENGTVLMKQVNRLMLTPFAPRQFSQQINPISSNYIFSFGDQRDQNLLCP